MSILLKNNAVFLHIPKTGGTFLRKVIVAAGLRQLDFGYEHADMERVLHSFKYYPVNAIRTSFLLRKNIDTHVSKCFKFCFVRNPYSWYESFWRFMKEYDWTDFSNYRTKNRFGLPTDEWNPIDPIMHCASNNFDEFIQNVLNEQPGFVANLYDRYANPQYINFIGKQESIIEDSITIFERLGISVSENIFHEIGKVNESQIPKPVWDEQLKKRIYESEENAFTKYGYNK